MEAKFIICVFKMLGLVFFLSFSLFFISFFFIYPSCSPSRHQLKPPDKQQQAKEVEESKVVAALLRLKKERLKKELAFMDQTIQLAFSSFFPPYFLKFNAARLPATYFAYL